MKKYIANMLLFDFCRYAKLKLAVDEITASIQTAKDERRSTRPVVADDKRERDKDKCKEKDKRKDRERDYERERSEIRYYIFIFTLMLSNFSAKYCMVV